MPERSFHRSRRMSALSRSHVRRTGTVIAGAAVALVLAVAGAPAADAQAGDRTLHLGTNGAPGTPTRVVYTCTTSGAVCGPVVAPPGRWTQTVTVPPGALVYLLVTAEAPPGPPDQGDTTRTRPDCWITDADGTTLTEGISSCIYELPPPPPPPAPGSN